MKDHDIKSKMKDWVHKGLENFANEDPLKIIDKYAEELSKNGLTTSQLRKFYGAVKKIDIESHLKPTLPKPKDDGEKSDEEKVAPFSTMKIRLLLPLLVYAVGRIKDDSNQAINSLYKVLEIGIYAIHNDDEFGNFLVVFQAIVAYHKYHETSNKLDANRAPNRARY